MLIDTHCHLTDKKYGENIEEILERARSVGVEKIIAPSTSLEEAIQTVKLADKYRSVYCLVGVHPEHVKEAAFDAIRAGKNGYTNSSGIPELRSAIADFHASRDGTVYDPRTEVLDTWCKAGVDVLDSNFNRTRR